MTLFTVSTFANVAYIPPDQTGYTATSTCGQRFSITYPRGTPASYPDVYGSGVNAQTPWKYLLIVQQSGGSPGTTSSAPSSSWDSVNGFPDDVLIRGIAVVEAQLTSFASGNTQVPGLGAMHHPGGIEGYYESRNRPNALKDTVFIIQHLRYNAASYPVTDARSYKLGDWFAIYGANSAFIIPWCGSAPSRACELGNGGPYEMSTVPNFIVANAIFPFNFMKCRLNETNTGGFFPAGETGGAGIDDTSAAGTAAAPRRYITGQGSYQLISDLGEACHPKTFAFSNTGPEDLNFGEPHIENVRKFNTGVHDAWHILTLRASLPPGTVEVRLSPAAQYTLSDSQQTATAIPGAYFDGALTAAATGHVASTGRVVFSNAPSDGDTITLSDGISQIVLEWDNNSSVTAGNTAVSLSGIATAAQATTRFRTAFNAAVLTAGLKLAKTDTDSVTTDITSTATDIAANATLGATGTVTGVRGLASWGTVDITAGQPADTNTVTLSDGARSAVFEFDSGGGVTAGNIAVTIGGSTAATMTNLLAAVASSGLGLRWNAGFPSTTATDFTFTSLGILGATPTWARVGANITLTQPNGGGAQSTQGFTAEDETTGAPIRALIQAAKDNIPRWDLKLPRAGIRRANQVAGARIAATGTISFSGQPNDGDSIVVGDGILSVTFEFDSSSAITAGRTGVTIGTTSAATMAALLAAIAQTALRLSWVAGAPSTTSTTFTSTLLDGNPNTTWTKSGANITVSGLSGGKQGRPRCIVPPANGNGRTGIWLTCMSLVGDSDLLYGPSAYNCRSRLRPGQRVWVDYSKLWARSAGGGSQVAKYEARECDERSK